MCVGGINFPFLFLVTNPRSQKFAFPIKIRLMNFSSLPLKFVEIMIYLRIISLV